MTQKPEQTPLQKYIDNIVDRIATKEGACTRNRKSDKVEFWIVRPNYTVHASVTYAELERCMMLATYPDQLLKYV